MTLKRPDYCRASSELSFSRCKCSHAACTGPPFRSCCDKSKKAWCLNLSRSVFHTSLRASAHASCILVSAFLSILEVQVRGFLVHPSSAATTDLIQTEVKAHHVCTPSTYAPTSLIHAQHREVKTWCMHRDTTKRCLVHAS